MKKVRFLVLCVLLMAATAAMAQTTAAVAQTAPDAAELTKLLNEFLAGASRNDPAVHERFWADDLIYTRSAGRRVNKAEILRGLRTAPAAKPTDPKTVYTAEDIRIQQYGNTAIVAFRLVATTDVEGTKQVQNLLNSGTFLKRNGKWQVVNWQSTRMPRTEEESKAEVAAAVAAFQTALAGGDGKKLGLLTDPTFVWTSGGGKQVTQKQLTDGAAPAELRSVKFDGSAVSVYGETAVVRGASYTMTFISQGGAWRLVALHTSE